MTRFRKGSAWHGLLLWALLGLQQGWADSPLDRDVPALKADQGYLLVAINSDTPIASLQLRRIAESFAVDTLKDLPADQTSYALYALDAGDYDLDYLTPDYKSNRRYSRLYYNVSKMRVEAGKINYPGTLIVRIPNAVSSIRALRHNRATEVMAWLETSFPKISAQVPLHYQGEFEDPFIDYYRQATQSEVAR